MLGTGTQQLKQLKIKKYEKNHLWVLARAILLLLFPLISAQLKDFNMGYLKIV